MGNDPAPRLDKWTSEVVTLEACPSCKAAGVPPNERAGYRFCLLCGWHDPFPPLPDGTVKGEN